MSRGRGGFFHPYVQLVIGGLLDASGELLLKQGANTGGGPGSPLNFLAEWFHEKALASGWTWLGVASYITGLFCWLYVLRTVPLSIAFPVVTVLHTLVPVGARVLLHEEVPAKRWLGLGLALVGMFLIVKPVARAEEKL